MLTFLLALWRRRGSDAITSHAAALAYFSVFSIAPLMFVILGVVGLVANNPAYHQSLLTKIDNSIGPHAAGAINAIIASQRLAHRTGLAFIVGGIGLVLGAIGIFGQLQGSINRILHVKTGPGAGLKPLLAQRLAGLGLIGAICFLLIASLAISAAGRALAGKMGAGAVFGLLDFIFSYLVFGVLLMLVYRTLAEVKIAWRLLFRTSLAVTLAFVIGKQILGFIIGRNRSISAFGAAGSLIALLLWIFYCSQIFYLGAAALSLQLEKQPHLMRPRYRGKDAVLKVENIEKPIAPSLRRRLADSFLNGVRLGWRQTNNKH